MTAENRNYRIFISAAEPSGDMHSANLISAVKERCPEAEFSGLGGPGMAAAGCRLLATTTDRAAMIYNAFGKLAFFYDLIKKTARYIRENRVDLVIVCDSPAFNFHIAAAAKSCGVPVMFYVAPQLWAWAHWLILKLRR